MPFVEVDIDAIIEEKCKNPEFAKEYELVQQEHRLVAELVEVRKKMGYTKKEIERGLGFRN